MEELVKQQPSGFQGGKVKAETIIMKFRSRVTFLLFVSGTLPLEF